MDHNFNVAKNGVIIHNFNISGLDVADEHVTAIYETKIKVHVEKAGDLLVFNPFSF